MFSKFYHSGFVTLLFLAGITLLFTSCEQDPYLNCDDQLFGIPYPNTGLTADQCKPICACKDFTSKQFSEDDLINLRNYTIEETFDELLQNPYDFPAPSSEGVCAVVVINKATKLYRVETFNTKEEAEQAGAILTHFDACGVCSTLQDFAVYAEKIDVGADVRNCALNNFTAPFDTLVACIEGIGFTKPCAQIWAYNTRNTQAVCFNECIANNIYNNPDGSLSECIECDEVKSGPVFKAVAGRTRRNTGIATSICRKCEEVEIVEHIYP